MSGSALLTRKMGTTSSLSSTSRRIRCFSQARDRRANSILSAWVVSLSRRMAALQYQLDVKVFLTWIPAGFSATASKTSPARGATKTKWPKSCQTNFFGYSLYFRTQANNQQISWRSPLVYQNQDAQESDVGNCFRSCGQTWRLYAARGRRIRSLWQTETYISLTSWTHHLRLAALVFGLLWAPMSLAIEIRHIHLLLKFVRFKPLNY